MIVLFLVVFWYRGARLGRQRRIRGAELVTARDLRRRVRPLHLRALDRMPGSARLSPYSIAGIPYPERTENRPGTTQGLPLLRGRVARSRTAAGASGMARPPVFVLGRFNSPAARSTCAQRSVSISDSRQPVTVPPPRNAAQFNCGYAELSITGRAMTAWPQW